MFMFRSLHADAISLFGALDCLTAIATFYNTLDKSKIKQTNRLGNLWITMGICCGATGA